MKKYLFSFLFLLPVVAVMAQIKPNPVGAPGKKKSKIILQKFRTLESSKGPDGKTVGKVHDGIFLQDFSTLRSDSAYYYADQNMIDAFGHVNINQGDTLNIFADKLHYDGNTKLATLTNHVKMVDKDATLTTDYLTYNTATRIANYTGGGKLVNKDNTLTSKNGYYFSFSRDAYFRYDVVCKTPDALIKTDTMRYNSGTRITYFYGPTHIYGNKDKDTLYTEDGNYNTVNEQARFGKKNLYSQGTKSLKGDSLFYDKLKGYGRAVKNVTFNDNEQKVIIKGDLGEFYKADDRAVVTQNPYLVFVTEEKDTTKADSAVKKIPLLLKNGAVGNKPVSTNKADSATVKRLGLTQPPKNKPDAPQGTAKNTAVVKQSKADSVTLKRLGLTPPASKNKAEVAKGNPVPVKNVMTVKGNIKADTTNKSKLITQLKADTAYKPGKDTAVRVKRDSLFMAADTLETQILTWKDLKTMQKERFAANNIDTTIKVVKHVLITKQPKVLTVTPPEFPLDTSFYHKDLLGKPKPKPLPQVKKKPVKPVDPKKLAADSIRNRKLADSLEIVANHGLKDTSRVRIISAHHRSKIFKSDLQAKSDSMFYTTADSTIRMFVKPMIWTQSSQLSGDTIYLQMKNKKLDNMDLFPSAFIVNIDKDDSLHFNQVGGLTMHGTFRDGKLHSMLVVGNAESIALSRDSATHKVKDQMRSLSSRLRVNFDKGELNTISYITKADLKGDPYKDVKEEDRILRGFIWKPKDRPASKEAIINTYKPQVKKKVTLAVGPVKGTMPIKSSSKTKGNKTQVNKPVTTPSVIKPAVKDSSQKIKADTVKKLDTLKKNTDPKAAKPGNNK
ncbi:MAG: OstA-like protein [Mucilaginibacter sp.]